MPINFVRNIIFLERVMLNYLLRQVDGLVFLEITEFVNYVLVVNFGMNFTIFSNVLMYVYQIQGLWIYQNISYQTQML